MREGKHTHKTISIYSRFFFSAQEEKDFETTTTFLYLDGSANENKKKGSLDQRVRGSIGHKMANKTTMKCFSQQQQPEQTPVPVFTISRAVTLQRALLLSP
jgi:hypothetical protein